MSRNKWIGLAALALVVAAAVTWYVASPYYTLRQMQEAARAGDADKLSGYIDYPSLREDLKAEFMARMAAEAQKGNSPFGALGLAFGSAMVGPLVDGMVSPAGVRAMLTSSHERESGASGKAAQAPVKVDDHPVIERRGLSEFAVRSKEGQGAMLFTRHGLGWKLSGVELPPDGSDGK